MENDTINKVYTAVSVFAFFVAANGLLSSQGSPLLFPLPMVATPSAVLRPGSSTALYSYAIGALAHMAASWLALVYASRAKHMPWGVVRLPVPFNLPLKPELPLAHAYRCVFAMMLFPLTLYCLGHCLQRVLTSPLYLGDQNGTPVTVQCHLKVWRWSNTPRLTSGNGVQYFGGYEAVALLVLALSIIIVDGCLAYRLLAPRRPTK